MSELIPLPRPSAGLQRRVQRELSTITVDTGLRNARIQSAMEIEAARVSAIAAVGERALQEVAMVSKLERDLAETVPAAVGRLSAIADMTQLALSTAVMNAGRRFGS